MFRLHCLLILGILAQLAFCSVRELPDSRTVGLKFGETAKDYVKFKPDMKPLEEAYSICTWAKKMRTDGSNRFWFSYGPSADTNEITLAILGYFHVFGNGLDLKGNFTDSLNGEWGHHCVTWAASSQAFRVYYQGELMGNKLTASGTKL